MIRVALPSHLRKLARVDDEILLDITGAATQRSVIDALEAKFPPLRGAIRDRATGERRAFVRFFACGNDITHESPDTPLPDSVASGNDTFMVVGAIAGG